VAFLTGYSKRKLAHWVKDGDVQANYQIQIVPHKSSDSDSGKDVYLGTNVQDDFDDIRLTKGDESTELDQWQESLISETSAIYWGEIHKVGSSLLSGNASSGQKVVDVNDGSVFAADDYALLIDDSNSEVCKIASINSNELTMVANLTNAYTTAANAKVCHCAYLYYKDDDAVLKSDGEDTFPFFDDFPGDSLDTNKWTDGSDGTGSVSVADSKVRIQAPNTSGHHGFAYTAADFVEPCALMVLGIDMDGIGNNQVQLNPGTDVGVTTNAARVDAYDLTGYGGGNSNVVWQIDYGGTPETVKTDADVGDTWNHDVEIQLKSDRKVEFFEDGVSKGTSTNPIEDVDFRIHLQTHGGRGVADWYADVVAVRKYIEGLTWGAWGEEESAGGAEYEKIATVYVGASVTASRLTDIVRTGAVALGLMVLAEKFREVIALVKIGLRMGVGWAVDIGDGAINGNGFGDAGDTWINKGNPANAAGVITTVKIWADINMTGCKVGIFYLTGTNKLKCRSAATIGSVTAGGERTFSGLSLAVEAGDYIGASASTGRIEASYDSYDGTWEKSGDYCVVDAEGTFTFWTGWKYSLYGEGASADVLCSRLVECFRIGTVNLGLATTASRLVEITRTSAVTIGKAVTASITGVVSVIADVQIGMSVSSSRLVEVARTSSVAVGLAATASYCKFKEFIGSVAIGMSVSASRAVEIIRSPVVQVGLSVTASRTVEIFRTATVAIGEIATAIIKAGREIVAVVFIGMSVSASRVKELVRAGTVALGLAVTASWLIPRIGRFLYVAITTSPYRKIAVTTSPYKIVRMVTAIYRSIKVFTFRR